MFDFSLEEGGIKPAAIQSWKRQDALNLQHQTLCLWSPKEGNCKNSLIPCQDANAERVQ